MKKMLLAICLVLVMASISFGQQVCPPTWRCPSGPTHDSTEYCTDPRYTCPSVTLGEMGSFDANDEWTYNPTYLTQMAAFGTNNASTFPGVWMPYKHLVVPGPGNPSLQSQFRSDGSKATRVTFNLPGKVTEWPDVYRLQFNGNHHSFGAGFTSVPPETTGKCIGNLPTNPDGLCTYPWFTKDNPIPVTFGSIQGIYWVEKTNLLPEPPVLSNQYQMPVSMELSAPPILSPNYHLIYGKFNFWQSPTSFPGPAVPVGKVMARWPGVVPDKDIKSTIRINMNDTTYDLVFAGGDTVNIPPIVQTTGINPRGKITQKVTPVEENGNLVIKWEPLYVTTPYMSLYVYVGSPWPADIIPTVAYFAWIEAVPQSSIVVLPKASWDIIKSKLSGKAQVMIMYQHQYMVPPSVPPIPPFTFTPSGTTFQVRGQSDIVEILY